MKKRLSHAHISSSCWPNIRVYASLFRIRFLNLMQYRTAALGEITTRFLWGFMEVMAYLTIFRANGEDLPLAFSQMTAYVWIAQSLHMFFLVVFGDQEIYQTIRSGGIAYELARPIDLYSRWFFQSIAQRLAYTILNGLPALIIALFLPAPYGLILNCSLPTLLLFLISMILGLCITVSFAMLLFVSLFYTMEHRGVMAIVRSTTNFLSGAVVPLPFFPEALLSAVELLPFASMLNTPLLIFSGGLTGTDALLKILLQLFWVITLIALGRLTMHRALRHLIVQGG